MAKKKKQSLGAIDFTGVESGGGSVPDGTYEVKVVDVERKTGKDSGEDYYAWEFVIVTPEKFKGRKLWHNTSLTQQSLWALRKLLEALGVEIPEDALDLDDADLIDRTVGAEVANEEYNKKQKPRIMDFFEFDEEDEEATKGLKKKVDDDEDEEEAPKKKKVDDEDEEPKKKTKKERREERKKKKAQTYTEDTIKEKDEEELAELIEEHELDVDMADFNTLKRKRAAVIDALEEKGLIEEA